jgi:hypothetical protein
MESAAATARTNIYRPKIRAARNPITKAFQWASKTDPTIIPLCGWWTRQTQAALGFFVLFTSTLALFSGTYTLTTLNVPQPSNLVLGGLWGMFIFYIDREIVGALDKRMAMVRPVLSLFIGVLVAVPVELWVFQDRVDQEIDKVYRTDNRDAAQKLEDGQKEILQRRGGLQNRYESLLAEDKKWGDVMDSELVGRSGRGRSGIAGQGPVYNNAAGQQARVRQLIAEARRDLDSFNQANDSDQARLEKQFSRQEVRKVTSFVVRYEALHRVTDSSWPLYWMSWAVTLFFVLIEMTPALMKILATNADYQHMVGAEMKENIVRIDEIAEQNLQIAMKHPTDPEPSVVEKFGFVRFGV